jgi:hypothetical protein
LLQHKCATQEKPIITTNAGYIILTCFLLALSVLLTYFCASIFSGV